MGAEPEAYTLKPEESGLLLVEQVTKMMKRLKVPNGLKAVGLKKSDIPGIVAYLSI